jgi:hypothetical protein
MLFSDLFYYLFLFYHKSIEHFCFLFANWRGGELLESWQQNCDCKTAIEKASKKLTIAWNLSSCSFVQHIYSKRYFFPFRDG